VPLEHTPDAEPPAVEHAPPRVWYVDPMDGTSDFVQRTGDFVVMIGLAVAGWPVLGAVYHPPSDTLYRGGHGVAPEKLVGDERSELRVSGVTDARQARLVVSRSHTPDVVTTMAAQLGIEKMEKCGSVGLKAARVAEGAGELYLHPSIGTKLWDTCAPEAILVAAGGTFSDCDGKSLVYDPSRYHNRRGVFASNGKLHDAVLERIRGSW
jgi:3'(2'), 5'-bisphosphate nucleotidase